MDYKMIVPVLIAFALSVIMGPVVIPILRKLKMGQTEREDGVQSHLKKAGNRLLPFSCPFIIFCLCIPQDSLV